MTYVLHSLYIFGNLHKNIFIGIVIYEIVYLRIDYRIDPGFLHKRLIGFYAKKFLLN